MTLFVWRCKKAKIKLSSCAIASHMKIREYPKVLTKQRPERHHNTRNRQGSKPPSPPPPLVVKCHTVVLLNASNRQQLELTIHSWEQESFPKRQVDTRQQIRQQSGVGEVKTQIAINLLITSCNMSNYHSHETLLHSCGSMQYVKFRVKWGSGTMEMKQRRTSTALPRTQAPTTTKAKTPSRATLRFFFADLVRGRAAPL